MVVPKPLSIREKLFEERESVHHICVPGRSCRHKGQQERKGGGDIMQRF